MKPFPKNIKNIEYLAKGKRSIVYTGTLNSQKVTIKTKRPESKAKERLQNEAKFLKILNKHKIGPKLISKGKDYIVYKYVDGTLLPDYLKKNKNNILIIKKVLDQCRTLDKLKINKLEFTRPTKHVFVKNNKVTMIDFERCYKTNNPKNVTQFCQFLINNLKINKKEFRELLKEYKKDQSDKNYKKILKFISSSSI